MTAAAEVASLIERLEAATADDANLMREVFEAVHPYPGPDHYLTPEVDWTWDRLQARFSAMLAVEAYESAALTLVPEGWAKQFAALSLRGAA